MKELSPPVTLSRKLIHIFAPALPGAQAVTFVHMASLSHGRISPVFKLIIPVGVFSSAGFASNRAGSMARKCFASSKMAFIRRSDLVLIAWSRYAFSRFTAAVVLSIASWSMSAFASAWA